MGCFSWICQKTDKGVKSSSFSGDAVHLFLLKEGKVIEHMYGNYDSYGAVFKKELRTDVDHELHDSFDWHMPWRDVCDLMFDNNEGNGICAILATHWKEGDPYPTTISDSDPNQGWGDDKEDLMGSTSDKVDVWVDEPFHKIIK